MARMIDPNDLAREMERIVRNVGARLEELDEQQEHVGTAADDMVTATVANREIDIDIHVLAKRRMEPDELGEAVVEAVVDAERQASAAITSLIDDGIGLRGDDPFHAKVRELMQSMRPPGL